MTAPRLPARALSTCRRLSPAAGSGPTGDKDMKASQRILLGVASCALLSGSMTVLAGQDQASGSAATADRQAVQVLPERHLHQVQVSRPVDAIRETPRVMEQIQQVRQV